MYKNIKNIDKIVFGAGSFNQLEEIIAPKRELNNKYFVFIVDDYFKGKELEKRLPLKPNDSVYFVFTGKDEPTTQQIDTLRDEIMQTKGLPSGVVGIGGGSAMDIAKALSVMVNQEGSSTLYQGFGLAKNPSVYHVGVPTISGTGAECSTTAVLTGPEKKLGIKGESTPFNQIVMDPELTLTVPRNHWFYTGMDTYIHCIESTNGRLNNTFSTAYADMAIDLCRKVYLNPEGFGSLKAAEDLMVASLFGGLSLSYSEVGACHALSYGLSYVLGARHGIANCIAFNVLEDFYSEGIDEFREMIKINNVDLPTNLSKNWTKEQIDKMSDIAYNLPHMWDHALGENWKDVLTKDRIKEMFIRM